MITEITLPANVTPISHGMTLTADVELSPNFALGHLLGATAVAALSDPLNEVTQGLATKIGDLVINPWQLATNLQHLAVGVMEPMLDAFGKDLCMNCAYLNPAHLPKVWDGTNSHFRGAATDIHVAGYAANMYPVLGEVQRALGTVTSELGLMFNNHSWVHVGVNAPHGSKRSKPKLWSWDLQTGQLASALFPLRGGLSRGVKYPLNHLTDKLGSVVNPE